MKKIKVILISFLSYAVVQLPISMEDNLDQSQENFIEIPYQPQNIISNNPYDHTLNTHQNGSIQQNHNAISDNNAQLLVDQQKFFEEMFKKQQDSFSHMLQEQKSQIINQVSDQITDLKIKIDTLQEQNAELKIQNNNLQNQMQQMTINHSEEISGIQSQLAYYIEQNSDLQNQLEHYIEQNSCLKNIVEQLKQQLAYHIAENSNLKNVIESLEKQIKNLIADNKNINNNINDKLTYIKNAFDEEVTKNAELRKAIEDMSKNINDLNEKIAIFTFAIMSLGLSNAIIGSLIVCGIIPGSLIQGGISIATGGAEVLTALGTSIHLYKNKKISEKTISSAAPSQENLQNTHQSMNFSSVMEPINQ